MASIISLIAVVVHACGGAPIPEERDWVTFKIRVLLEEASPGLPRINVDKNPEHCGDSLLDPVLLVGAEGGVKNCVISLEPIYMDLSFKLDPAEVRVESSDCLLKPRVQCLPLDSTLKLQNVDSITHNPHLWSPDGRTAANVTLFNDKLRPIVELSSPGAWRLDCDIHDWMRAYVHVFPHPLYALTGPDGSASFPTRCPPGKYRLRVWHEVLGERVEEIVVSGVEHSVHLPLSDHRPERLIPDGMAAWLE